MHVLYMYIKAYIHRELHVRLRQVYRVYNMKLVSFMQKKWRRSQDRYHLLVLFDIFFLFYINIHTFSIALDFFLLAVSCGRHAKVL